MPMRWADLDSLNHVNNVVYLDYAAESRALLVEDGVLATDEQLSRIAVDFVRPMLLSSKPVRIVSTRDGAELTQEICVDSDAGRTVFARVVTALGECAEIASHESAGKPLPSRVRRSDLDPSGAVSPTKVFELFQEGRILFIADHLTEMSPGRFVVARVDVRFGAPMTWRRLPYEVRSWISRVGDSSVTIETQLTDGALVMAQSVTALVGFDLTTQRSRRLTDTERAELADASCPD